MDVIFNGVDWVVVVVGAIISFVLGSVWYSNTMFGEKWRKGLGTPAVAGRALGPLLAIEAVACFLFAWLLVVTAAYSTAFAIFTAIVISVAIKSNGMFNGKTVYAVAVESGYILAKAAVIIIIFQIFN